MLSNGVRVLSFEEKIRAAQSGRTIALIAGLAVCLAQQVVRYSDIFTFFKACTKSESRTKSESGRATRSNAAGDGVVLHRQLPHAGISVPALRSRSLSSHARA